VTAALRRPLAWGLVAVAAVAWLAAGVTAVLGLWPAPAAAQAPSVAAAAPAAVATATTRTPDVAVAGVAELVAAAWLGGDPRDLTAVAPLVTGSLPAAPPAGARYAARVAPVAAAPAGAGTWELVLAAQVLRRVDGGYVPDGLTWLAVTVDTTGPRPLVVAGPEEHHPEPRRTP
jgi:hypothetical protein